MKIGMLVGLDKSFRLSNFLLMDNVFLNIRYNENCLFRHPQSSFERHDEVCGRNPTKSCTGSDLILIVFTF